MIVRKRRRWGPRSSLRLLLQRLRIIDTPGAEKRSLLHPGFVENVLGHNMYQSIYDLGVELGSLRDAKEEQFEFGEIGAIRGFVRPGDVVLDLGANIGYFTCLFARRVGTGGRVIAF